MIVKISDHASRIKELLPQQWKDLPNIDNLLTLFATKVQEIENMMFQLLEDRVLDAAAGQQLDGIGEIVGETRNGRGDAEYKSALDVRIKINISSGTPETMIDVMASLTNSTHINFIEQYPAEVELHSNGDFIPPNLLENIKRIAPAAVAVYLTVVGPNITTPFQFDGGPGSGFDQGQFVHGE